MCERLPCVCDICNCGKHKCPHKLKCPGPWDKCTLSEYNRQFIPHEICLSKSFKPSYTALLGEGPLSKETTNRVDFIPRCVEMPKTFKPADYIKPEGKIDDMTMYRKEFGPKEACPPISIKPAPRRSVPAKFEGTTTNRSDFQTWDLPPPISHKQIPFKPCEDKFEGIGSYERDFIVHCVEPTKSYKPITSFMNSMEPMAQNTDYRESYIKHPIERTVPKREICQVRSYAPLESLTTNKKEYTPKEICVRKSFKPLPHFIQADKPLSNETTNRTDFRMHDVSAPYKYEPGKYMKPEGNMDLKTTYNKDFVDLPACRSYSIKQPVNKMVSAPFDSNTNYRNDFKKWDVPPVKAVLKESFEASTDPFDDCTTSKSAFVQHELCPVKSYKPAPHMLSTDPFDDATMYRTEYTKKCQPHCPAALLNTNTRSVSPDGYIYQCADNRGHLHYRRGAVVDDMSQKTKNSNNNDILKKDTVIPLILPQVKA